MPKLQAKKVVARFYAETGSEPPSEPVREWLRRLPDEDKKESRTGHQMSKANPHIGSSFEGFLHEEGIYEAVEQLAAKKLIAQQLRAQMDAAHLSKSAMATRLQTIRSQLDRVLDPDNESVTLATLERAARAIGKRLRVSLEELSG